MFWPLNNSVLFIYEFLCLSVVPSQQMDTNPMSHVALNASTGEVVDGVAQALVLSVMETC